jgi:hypothetical protein
VDPDATKPWWDGWTLHQGAGSLKSIPEHPLAADIVEGRLTPAATANCPAGTANANVSATVFQVAFPVCLINAPITADTKLTSDHVYLLTGTINVGNGGVQGATPATATPVTLTIEAGTQIYGALGTSAALVITRGSKIFVNGTAELPVVMSSADGTDPATANIGAGNDYTGPNEWGGLIIDGFGVVNEGAEVLSEAAPDGVNRFFGGNNPLDSSGAIRYLVIAESGEEFRQDEEIQGLTLEGVGSGTVIDYVQVHYSGDDGIEWFGGTVNAKHLVVTAADDDSFDMDLGYQGGVQFAIAVQSNGLGDRTIESDNNGDNFDQLPISTPTFSNITLVGRAGRPDTTTTGALHREGFGGFIHKAIITDAGTAPPDQFEDGCLDIDDTTARITDGSLVYQDAIFNCAVPGPLSAPDEDVPPPATPTPPPATPPPAGPPAPPPA